MQCYTTEVYHPVGPSCELTFKVLIHPFAGFWLRDTLPCLNNSPRCDFHSSFNGLGIIAPALEFTSVLLSCGVPCNFASVVAIGNIKLTFAGTFRNNEFFTVNFNCAFVHDIQSFAPPLIGCRACLCVSLRRCVYNSLTPNEFISNSLPALPALVAAGVAEEDLPSKEWSSCRLSRKGIRYLLASCCSTLLTYFMASSAESKYRGPGPPPGNWKPIMNCPCR